MNESGHQDVVGGFSGGSYEEEYSIVPERNGDQDGFGVVHRAHGGGLGCMRFAATIEEAKTIIAELKKAKA